MKITLMSLTIGSLVGLSSAYTISVTNQSTFGDPALPLVDNTGAPLSSATISVGYFSSDSEVTSNAFDFASLLASFNEYGTSTSIAGGAAPGLLDLVTPDNWTNSVPSNSTGGQIGQNIYVVISDYDSSVCLDRYAVFKSDAVFGTEDDVGNGGAVVDLALGKGELLLGQDLGSIDLTAGPTTISYSNSIGLVGPLFSTCFPEPSTSICAVLAGFAFAFRRRR